MSWIIRGIAVLTVLLGLATMAVSVYAARNEAAELSSLRQATAQQQPLGAAFATPTPTAVLQDEPPSQATPVQEVSPAAPRPSASVPPFPTPTVELRYPVPEDAAPVARGRSSRSDLSLRPRTYRVLSLRPGPRPISPSLLPIPPDQLAVMQRVSMVTGIPWQIFAAIARVESNFGSNMATSSAGAIGYGQFLPAMWAAFGNGGDPYDFRDAIPAMGRYLVAAGAPEDLIGAIYSYNHSWYYVQLVLSYALSYGMQLPVSTDGLIWPVVGPISSFFGPAHPLGIDIDQTALPGMPVLAAHDGTVFFAGGDPCCSYGRYVILAGDNGLVTLYAHLDLVAVSAGRHVRQGQPLGSAGCTGHCTAPHLHFEVIEEGVRRNPLDYLP